MPNFMVHDRWANVLFLHWRVPPDLEPLLESEVGDFTLDRTPDGSAWIGMVLLTEQGVGLPYLRSSLTCVTHHGVNIRTYVKVKETRGIHFSSLECDDRFTAFGANYFGMPYKVAHINRRYLLAKGNKEDGGVLSNSNEDDDKNIQNLASSNERDDFACTNGKSNGHLMKFQLSSVRSSRDSSLFNLLYSMFSESRMLHSTDLGLIESPPMDKRKQNEPPLTGSKGDGMEQPYTVKCEWERCAEENVEDPKLAEFFLERYFVYTHKYGLKWRGQVEHEPWPVEGAVLKKLIISNVCKYEPSSMRPMISYMASRKPDSILFSPGVGPVEFNMLRPV